MKVVKLTPDQWKQMAEAAHLTVFNELRASTLDRIDYALMVVDGDLPLSYMTCREVDEETVYMPYGGAFPSARGNALSYRSYELMIGHLATHYKRATTLIENTNTAMMKFAMKAGLRVIGVRNFKGAILLEHHIEWGI